MYMYILLVSFPVSHTPAFITPTSQISAFNAFASVQCFFFGGGGDLAVKRLETKNLILFLHLEGGGLQVKTLGF